MNKLMVIGNCYGNTQEYAQELFTSLESLGYTLGYQSDTSVVIMKEELEEDNES